MEHGQGKFRVIVGDDHEALRAGLVGTLGDAEDMEVVGQAGSGEQTLALIERRRPHVALVDLHMEGMSGIDVCRAATEKELEVAICLYTADRNPATALAAMEAGARGYLLKAGPLSDVPRAVRAVARQETFIDPTLAMDLMAERQRTPENILSARETEVLQLLAQGVTTAEAAKALYLSPATVRSYIESAMQKLSSRNRTQAVADALREGFIG